MTQFQQIAKVIFDRAARYRTNCCMSPAFDKAQCACCADEARDFAVIALEKFQAILLNSKNSSADLVAGWIDEILDER